MNRPAGACLDRTREGVPLLTRALPFDALEALAGRSRRLADLVESISRRADVRSLRARLLLLLLELRCPPRVRPRRPWYVPGAVARLGVEGLRRAWRAFYGEEPPCPRTVRAHLGLLERCRALVRSPGDWAAEPGEGRYRPRHADTLHVLEDEASVELWEGRGAPALRAHPEARANPDAWRKHVGSWRRPGRAAQLELFGQGTPVGVPDQVGRGKAAGASLARALDALGPGTAVEALDALRVLGEHGACIRGRPTWELAADRRRLLGAGWLLALALARGDSIRNRAAWLVRAHRHADRTELDQARARALGYVSGSRTAPPPGRGGAGHQGGPAP